MLRQPVGFAGADARDAAPPAPARAHQRLQVRQQQLAVGHQGSAQVGRKPGVEPVVGQGGLGVRPRQRMQQRELLAAQTAVALGLAVRRKGLVVQRQQLGLAEPVQPKSLGPFVNRWRLFAGLVRFDDQADQPPTPITLPPGECAHAVDNGVMGFAQQHRAVAQVMAEVAAGRLALRHAFGHRAQVGQMVDAQLGLKGCVRRAYGAVSACRHGSFACS